MSEASASVAAKGRPARQKGVLRDVTAIPGAATSARTLKVQAYAGMVNARLTIRGGGRGAATA